MLHPSSLHAKNGGKIAHQPQRSKQLKLL